jgi:hypothetical protein
MAALKIDPSNKNNANAKKRMDMINHKCRSGEDINIRIKEIQDKLSKIEVFENSSKSIGQSPTTIV